MRTFKRQRNGSIRFLTPGEIQKEANRVAMRARRRALLMQEGGLTTSQWRHIVAYFGNRCLACSRHERSLGYMLTIDHIIPFASGGRHVAQNVQPLCRPCNGKKAQQTIDYRPGPLPLHLLEELEQLCNDSPSSQPVETS